MLRSIQFCALSMTSALLMGSLGAALAGAAGAAVTATAIIVVARAERIMVRRDIVDMVSTPYRGAVASLLTIRRLVLWWFHVVFLAMPNLPLRTNNSLTRG